MNLGNLHLPARHVLLFLLAVMLCSLSPPPSSSLTHGSTWLGQGKMFLPPLSPRAVAAAASGSVLLLLPACVPRQAHMGPRIGGPLPGHCRALHPPASASVSCCGRGYSTPQWLCPTARRCGPAQPTAT